MEKKESANNEENNTGSFFCYKFVKQICLVGIYISTGLLFEVVSPCIPDLKERIGLNYEEISRALTGTSVGLVVGSVSGGILHERFYKYADLLLAFSMFVGGLGIIIVPWMTSIWALGFSFFCCGFEANFNNPGCMSLVFHMWGDKGGPPVYSLAFGFGLGGLIAPQIAKQFLVEGPSTDTNATMYTEIYNGSVHIQSYENMNTLNGTATYHNPNLIYPFIIVGGINFLFTIIFIIFYVIGPPKGVLQRKGATNIKSLCTPRSCFDEGNCYGITVLVVLFFYYVHCVGGEHLYGKWIFSFAIETDVNFTKDQAANLASIFWFCHMTGRGSGMIYSKFVPTKIVIICDVIATIITATLLCIFGHKVPILLYILTACMGLLIGPLFPAGMLWAELYFRVNSMSIMTCMMGASMGYFLYVYAGGYTLEYYGPRTMMFLVLGFGVMLMLTFALMEIIVRCFSYKHNDSKNNRHVTSIDMDVHEKEQMLDINT